MDEAAAVIDKTAGELDDTTAPADLESQNGRLVADLESLATDVQGIADQLRVPGFEDILLGARRVLTSRAGTRSTTCSSSCGGWESMSSRFHATRPNQPRCRECYCLCSERRLSCSWRASASASPLQRLGRASPARFLTSPYRERPTSISSSAPAARGAQADLLHPEASRRGRKTNDPAQRSRVSTRGPPKRRVPRVQLPRLHACGRADVGKPAQRDVRDLRRYVPKSTTGPLRRIRHGARHASRSADRSQPEESARVMHAPPYAIPRVHVHPWQRSRPHARLPRPARRSGARLHQARAEIRP